VENKRNHRLTVSVYREIIPFVTCLMSTTIETGDIMKTFERGQINILIILTGLTGLFGLLFSLFPEERAKEKLVYV
jgi:hypothetical protein